MSLLQQTGLQNLPTREDRTSPRRFTVDGDAHLEAHLRDLCVQALAGVRQVIPRCLLRAMWLGGGYGRGEGGVLSEASGDRPYNDLEFYVCLRGSRLVNRRLFGRGLHRLGDTLTHVAGIEVEFEIISLTQLRKSPPSMFFYDLAAGHHLLWGEADLLEQFPQHGDPRLLPLETATRLLMNRGTGLLFSRQKLAQQDFTSEDADFVRRNIAKAQLAIGDALLTAFGQYHWSCRERHARLRALRDQGFTEWAALACEHHAAGVEFKLHPRHSFDSPSQLRADLDAVAELMRVAWLFVESRRLGKDFRSVPKYLECEPCGEEEGGACRRRLMNARMFGPKEMFARGCQGTPRERVFKACAALLWAEQAYEVIEKKWLKPSASSRYRVADPVDRYRSVWQRLR